MPIPARVYDWSEVMDIDVIGFRAREAVKPKLAKMPHEVGLPVGMDKLGWKTTAHITYYSF